MLPSVDKDFLSNTSLEFSDGLYFQKNLNRSQSFEKEYISLRKKEGRIYSDALVAKLPDIEPSHSLSEEWAVRKTSTKRLIQYLKQRQPKKILEVGCGNGWLTHCIHSSLKVDCLGVDVNETELRQAVRVFGNHPCLTFIYADIFSASFDNPVADAIVLAGVLSYFSDASGLLTRLVSLLPRGGQLHIIDSPFYKDKTIQSARERSTKYFDSLNQTEMQFHYFHHLWNVLDKFNFKINYNPDTLWNRVFRKVHTDSPFPWIVITK